MLVVLIYINFVNTGTFWFEVTLYCESCNTIVFTVLVAMASGTVGPEVSAAGEANDNTKSVPGIYSMPWDDCKEASNVQGDKTTIEEKSTASNSADSDKDHADESNEGWSTVKGKVKDADHRQTYYSRGRGRYNRFYKKKRYNGLSHENSNSNSHKSTGEASSQESVVAAGVNGNVVDTSSAESPDLECKKGNNVKKDSSPKEYVAAPMPKVNPWSKDKSLSKQAPKLSTADLSSESRSETHKAPMIEKSNKSASGKPTVGGPKHKPQKPKQTYKSSSGGLPPTCAWAKGASSVNAKETGREESTLSKSAVHEDKGILVLS